MAIASAIHATLFATARLARRVAKDQQLPQVLVRHEKGGAPAVFLIGLAVVAGAVQFFGSLAQIVTFSSLVFLLVFATVNLAAAAHRFYPQWRRPLPWVGAAGCLAATGVLTWDTFHGEAGTFWFLLGATLLLGLLRGAFVLSHRGFKARHG